ncbi:hypothetical protein Dsin_010926 [Dipteronia sinensis]|uniref:Leucine-rich repeat-containing N-terminal plant-type domain-containing protein n=1 Tax=Dipteronia sinensis TaxID=43782 RepID=A0AAE0ATD5_9ROSI|nr:hypothetical protein Dsin_010926 [Dipteronia sinensis]
MICHSVETREVFDEVSPYWKERIIVPVIISLEKGVEAELEPVAVFHVEYAKARKCGAEKWRKPLAKFLRQPHFIVWDNGDLVPHEVMGGLKNYPGVCYLVVLHNLHTEHSISHFSLTGMVAALTNESATSKSVYFAHCTSEMIFITHLLAEEPEKLAGPLLVDTYGVSAVKAFYEMLSESCLSVQHPEENKPVAPVELCPILKMLYKILIKREFPSQAILQVLKDETMNDPRDRIAIAHTHVFYRPSLLGDQTFPSLYRIVDVRDVVYAHILAFEVPTARGIYCVVGRVSTSADTLMISRKCFPTLHLLGIGDCMELERKALIDFKSSLHDPKNQLSSWRGANCCQWRGITSDNQTGAVIAIYLHNPYARNNNLTQSLPEFLQGAEDCSGLNSPLPRLRYLKLSHNQFGGKFPEWLPQLHNLEVLHLHKNLFQGPIPPSLGTLGRLSGLDLGRNILNGTLPDRFGQLSKLEHLGLSSNNLIGMITEVHLSELSKLAALYLFGNSFEFNVRSIWVVPPFQVSVLYMGSCNLGPLFPHWLKCKRSSIPASIAEVQTLTVGDLSRNNLTGSIPLSIGNCMDLEALNLQHNNLSGEIPTSLGDLQQTDTASWEQQNLGKNPIIFKEFGYVGNSGSWKQQFDRTNSSVVWRNFSISGDTMLQTE